MSDSSNEASPQNVINPNVPTTPTRSLSPVVVNTPPAASSTPARALSPPTYIRSLNDLYNGVSEDNIVGQLERVVCELVDAMWQLERRAEEAEYRERQCGRTIAELKEQLNQVRRMLDLPVEQTPTSSIMDDDQSGGEQPADEE